MRACSDRSSARGSCSPLRYSSPAWAAGCSCVGLPRVSSDARSLCRSDSRSLSRSARSPPHRMACSGLRRSGCDRHGRRVRMGWVRPTSLAAPTAAFRLGVAHDRRHGRLRCRRRSSVPHRRSRMDGLHAHRRHRLSDRLRQASGRKPGAAVPSNGDSSYNIVLSKLLSIGYPAGGQATLGVVADLIRTDMSHGAYQAFLAFATAMGALAIFSLLGRVTRNGLLRCIGAAVAMQPNILYAYTLEGWHQGDYGGRDADDRDRRRSPTACPANRSAPPRRRARRRDLRRVRALQLRHRAVARALLLAGHADRLADGRTGQRRVLRQLGACSRSSQPRDLTPERHHGDQARDGGRLGCGRGDQPRPRQSRRAPCRAGRALESGLPATTATRSPHPTPTPRSSTSSSSRSACSASLYAACAPPLDIRRARRGRPDRALLLVSSTPAHGSS